MTELEKAIAKYKARHPRIIEVNFGDGLEKHETEQLGLDIIEQLEKIIQDLQTRV